MRKITKGNGGHEKAAGMPPGLKDVPERSDKTRLMLILHSGFGVASGYHNLSRDRHYVHLKEGVSHDALLRFCMEHLKGSPIPCTDPIHDGPALLRMFSAAEKENLVRVEFVKAGRFIPERA